MLLCDREELVTTGPIARLLGRIFGASGYALALARRCGVR
jgi:hypothetical protein